MPVSHTGTYWQSLLQVVCTTQWLSAPVYEVFEHNGGNIALDPYPPGLAGGRTAPTATQCLYSCIVNVGGRDFETAYVYRAEENAKERAAKKAYEALSI
ncbi:hypothetical protein BZA05DRAFT_24210 [Tricharina praecox]|uniref:uncharacterized protein n=1 Tax=Tricharina praecox TaxID=43433 RepID=UPI00221E78DD|nr:uncharacterized protein BZA05DRAFT_24210 [Tricharina praecox]KAI5859215.1 hypothetical protein BZA05DRAFT_24210 [Tricharina praecox]